MVAFSDVVLTWAVRLGCVAPSGVWLFLVLPLLSFALLSLVVALLCSRGWRLRLVLLLPGQLCFGLQCLLLCTCVGCFHFASWRYLLCIFIPYEHWKSRTDCGFFGCFSSEGSRCYSCLYISIFLQSYRTLAEWEFGWGGTSVIMQHRCPKGSSVRTETSLRV